MKFEARGGVVPAEDQLDKKMREIHLLQRKTTRIGRGLGKTTGWIHKASLDARGVQGLTGCTYKKVSPRGLHVVQRDPKSNLLKERVLAVDDVIICAGQESDDSLYNELVENGGEFEVHLIGGAQNAAGLDAKRASKS